MRLLFVEVCQFCLFELFCFVCFPKAIAKVFKSTPDDLDMHVIYDVSHNIAKIEEHVSFVAYVTYNHSD